MDKLQSKDCFVCSKHQGKETIPGGAIYEDELIFISHSPLWGDEKEHYLGHLFIETKRHVPQLADLTEEESKSIGLFTSRAAQALINTVGAEHVYSFFIGDGVPHVHIHVIARYPGAPKEYWGPKVDDWPDAPKGGEKEISQLTSEIQTFFENNY